jgi:hypothetical protein
MHKLYLMYVTVCVIPTASRRFDNTRLYLYWMQAIIQLHFGVTYDNSDVDAHWEDLIHAPNVVGEAIQYPACST